MTDTPIDRNQFALWMGMLADRFGRELKPPTLRVYYELLAEEVDTAAFVRGCKAVLKRESFFPSVQQIIDAGNAGTDASLRPLRAFRQIADGRYPYSDPVAREAMNLCGLWGALDHMHPGTRASKERQFLETYAALLREHRADIALQVETVTRPALKAGSAAGTITDGARHE